MNPRPLVIVSLPGRRVAELQGELREGELAGADIAEVRVDRLEPGERSHLGELFPSPLPLLGTYRSQEEGGEGSADPGLRHGILLELQALGFAWVDLEFRRDGPLEPNAARVVLSAHWTAPTPWPEIAVELRRPAVPRGIVKIVLRASVRELLEGVIPALPPPGETPATVLTTGGAGPLLRVWARRHGFPATFGSLPPRGWRPDSERSVEPSQLPVNDLARWFSHDDGATLFAVVGQPIHHSLSPRLHNAWMAEAQRPGLYLPLEMADGPEFVDTLPRLAELGFRGFNITHPFKQLALELAEAASPSAERCGAANVLTYREGEATADNTDLAALVRRFEELVKEGVWDGRSVTVLGSGGGGRAALAAAALSHARSRVIARSEPKARGLAREFGAEVGPPSGADPGLVVHATTSGRAGSLPLELPLENVIVPGSRVLDLVYLPESRSLSELAAHRGSTYEDGWRLLIYQALESYQIWWDAPPPSTAVERLLEVHPCGG